jgi:hypothetical protein
MFEELEPAYSVAIHAEYPYFLNEKHAVHHTARQKSSTNGVSQNTITN